MANTDYMLPGGCYVKQITCDEQGILLKPKLISPNGFTEEQAATLIIMPGRIIISTDPREENLMEAIEELQLRQDELKQDFEPAILALLGVLTPS